MQLDNRVLGFLKNTRLEELGIATETRDLIFVLPFFFIKDSPYLLRGALTFSSGITVWKQELC